jgi:hypothetical protein
LPDGAATATAPEPAPAALLARVARIADVELAPIARRVDADGLYPEPVLRALGGAAAFEALAAGDPALGLPIAVAVGARIAEECLATSFCAWCQYTLVWYLRNTENAPLRDRFLGDVAAGRLLGGTGLSNAMKALAGIEPLRLVARRTEGGYVVSGQLPWVSNLGPRHVFGTVFAVRDGAPAMALVECAAPGVELVPAPPFLALDGTRTFAVRFRDVLVPHEFVLAQPAEQYIERIRAGFVLLQTGMGIGLLRACAALMRREREARPAVNAHLPDPPELFERAAVDLEAEVATLARTPFDPASGYWRAVLSARLAVAETALRAAQAAMLHAGARGYVAGSAAERRLREAFFVAIVTPATKHLRKLLATPTPTR